ncbi:MAG: YitT family protein [Oscillospiraceae bacterium]|nr:YitT family protein [Oscillospiraceae bacterium]
MNKLKRRAIRIVAVLFAVSLLAVAINLFLGPHNIAAGGITGLSIVFETLFGFDRFVTILVANAIVLVATFIFLGKEIFFNTVIGAAYLPVIIGVVPQYMMVEDPMLSMFVGSTIIAVAASIMYANNASSGGTTVPPLILKKYFGLSTSIGLFISDGAVVILSLIVFSFEAFLYAIFSITLAAITMNFIESGLRKRKMVYIISDKSKEITHDILTKIDRGVTLIPILGAFERTEREMIMVTMDSKNYRDLINIVNEHDEHAFMITDNVTQVHGRGFTYDSGSV